MSNDQNPASESEQTQAPAEAGADQVPAEVVDKNPGHFKRLIGERDTYKQRVEALESEKAERERAEAEGDSAKRIKLLEKELAKATKERDGALDVLSARDKKDRNRAVLDHLKGLATDGALVEAAYEKEVREGTLEDGPEDAAEAIKQAEKVLRKRFSSLFKPKNTQPPANAGQPGVIPGAAPADAAARTAKKVAEESRARGRPIPPGFQ